MSSPALTPATARRITFYGFICAALVSATSSASTPLYPLYRSMFHLTPGMITLVFGIYAFSLLIALLTLGRLSDYIGRRPLILLALVLNAVALVIFMLADSASMLITARVVQGFAVGVALPTFGATVLDADKARGPILNSVSAFCGLTTGTLLGAILVTYAPFPVHLIYAVLFAMMVIAMLLLAWIPETVTPIPGALAALRPRISIPRRALGPLLRLTPVNIAAWALGGFYLSLMPTLVIMTTGITSPLVGGTVVSTLMLSATASVFIFRQWQPQRALFIGTWLLMAGVVVTLGGINSHSVVMMFIGTAIAGQGFGSVFSTILKIVLPLAESHERAGLFAAFLVKSYLAFSLPAILAGVTAPHIGLTPTVNAYGTGIIALACLSLIAVRISSRRNATAL